MNFKKSEIVRYVSFFLMFARFALFKDTNLFRRKSLKEGLRHLSRHQDLLDRDDDDVKGDD